MIKINPQRLDGIWQEGWALDLHTISSIPLPDGSFDTTRTAIGEMLYQLKYRFDRSQIQTIAVIASSFLQSQSFFPKLEGIVPVPPSDESRPFQPVLELAKAIGRKVNLPVYIGLVRKVRKTDLLKNVEDPETRRKLLRGAFRVDDKSLKGKCVLLFDDLFRSGVTLSEVARTLIQQGEVKEVYVMTITKTRTKR